MTSVVAAELAGTVGLEHLAQLRHVAVKRGGSGVRGRLAPQRVDEAVRRYDLVGVQEQDSEQRPLLAPPERQRLVALEHLEWAQYAEVRPGAHEPNLAGN